MKKRPAKSAAEKAVVLVGCNGFLGSNLLKTLETSPRYRRVVAIDRTKPGITLRKTRFHKLDLTATLADAQLVEILKTENAEQVIHTAIPMSPLHNEALAHEITAIGTYYVCNACTAAGIKKLTVASTADVYGAFPDNPNYLTEDMPVRGHLQNHYLADRIDAEKQALKFQKRHPEAGVSIVRCATTLGPTVESFKTRFLRRSAVSTMIGFDPLMQFVHQDDVISAFVWFIDGDHPGVFNLGADGVMPLSRVIRLSGNFHVPVTQIGFKSMVQLMWYADLSPAPASFADFLRYLCVVDNSKIKKAGFTPRYTSRQALDSFVEAQRLKKMALLEREAYV